MGQSGLTCTCPPSFSAASLQTPVPFLSTPGAGWTYQGSKTFRVPLLTVLRQRFNAWSKKLTDKRTCPVITITGGPGCGKSRLLSELKSLSISVAAHFSDDSGLLELLSAAFVFHVGFENGTRFQESFEKDGAVAVGNRMMWQLMRKPEADYGDFARKHSYHVSDALNKLSVLTGKPAREQPVFLLVDGLDKLGGSTDRPFREAVTAVSAAVCGFQFVVGAISAILCSPITAVFGDSQQAREYLRPPLLMHPKRVVPDTLVQCSAVSVRWLNLLRNDMGGYGRALETRFAIWSGSSQLVVRALCCCAVRVAQHIWQVAELLRHCSCA
jgi:hypothetical protein